MRSYAASDIRPNWEPRPYTQGQADLIKLMMSERDITNEMLLKVFPTRPSTFADGSKVIEWLKGQTKKVDGSPSQPSSPQAKLPVNVDKNGKARPTHYAIEFEGKLRFFRIKAGRKPGMYFVDEQASDSLYPVRAGARRGGILGTIMKDPQAAMQRYGSEIGRCSMCHRTLTDETSRALGIGPDCRSK